MCAPLDWILDPSTGRDFEKSPSLRDSSYLGRGRGNAGCGLVTRKQERTKFLLVCRLLLPNPVMEEWPVIQGSIPRHDETLKSNVAFGHPATSRRR